MLTPPRIITRARSILVVVLGLVILAGAIYLRLRPPPRAGTAGEPEVVPPPTAEATPAPFRSEPAPMLPEVESTLTRVFGPTLTLDGAAQPAFLAGDFNGDGIADLAVAVQPRGEDAVPALNSDLAAWSRQDADAPPPDTLTRRHRVTLAGGDRLLAIVHGVAGGWRDPEALQGYLVKNAVRQPLHRRPLSAMPEEIRMRALRVHVGDVIAGNRRGETGLIFWTGATYAWAALRPAPAP